jgi:hypothetical protein
MLAYMGASLQSDNSLENSSAGGVPIHTTSIDNFTFIDFPKEEIDILNQLGKHQSGAKKKQQVVLNPSQINRDNTQTQVNRLSVDPAANERFIIASSHLMGGNTSAPLKYW